MQKFFIRLALLVLLISCESQSKILSSWKYPDSQPKDYQKLMVMAIFPSMQVRATVEDALVQNLAKQGITATVSYGLFPLAGKQKEIFELAKQDTSVINEMKRNMKEKIKREGIEGVFMISLFNKEVSQQYHENTYMSSAYAYGYYPAYYGGVPSGYTGSYYDYYMFNSGVVHREGYYTSETTFYIQTNLFDVEEDQLIYAVQGSTIDHHDVEGEADDLGRKVVRDLKENRVLKFPEEKI